MDRTPGFLLPSAFPSEDLLRNKLQELSENAGFTSLDPELLHLATKPSLEELIHFGVKGMRWGVRNSEPRKAFRGLSLMAVKEGTPKAARIEKASQAREKVNRATTVSGYQKALKKVDPGVSRRTNREAAKDAKEFARAKMFYGQGAGTRRKLIKATVEGKSKRDPAYKKAFDANLAKQDMSSHASKARGERKRKNVVNSTTKTARGVGHILNGNAQYASAAAAMLVGGALYARKAGVDRVILNAGKTAMRNLRSNNFDIKAGMPASEFLRKMNI